MASLMENLMDILEKEQIAYEELLVLSIKKTPVLVSGDTNTLQKITDEEQLVVSAIHHMDKQREELYKDIANVMNKDVNTLRLVDLISLLEQRPSERKRLARVNDRLKETVEKMRRINEQNKQLIENSLEMVEFDLSLMQGIRSAPETANYNRGAMSSGEVMGQQTGSFDAKQ